MANPWAAGKRAYGFCDLCSFRYPLFDLKNLTVKGKKTETRACPACWTPDQPQLMVGMRPVVDPQALRNPRPDTGLSASRATFVPVYNFTPSGYTSATVAVGHVTVVIS